MCEPLCCLRPFQRGKLATVTLLVALIASAPGRETRQHTHDNLCNTPMPKKPGCLAHCICLSRPHPQSANLSGCIPYAYRCTWGQTSYSGQAEEWLYNKYLLTNQHHAWHAADNEAEGMGSDGLEQDLHRKPWACYTALTVSLRSKRHAALRQTSAPPTWPSTSRSSSSIQVGVAAAHSCWAAEVLHDLNTYMTLLVVPGKETNERPHSSCTLHVLSGPVT